MISKVHTRTVCYIILRFARLLRYQAAVTTRADSPYLRCRWPVGTVE